MVQVLSWIYMRIIEVYHPTPNDNDDELEKCTKCTKYKKMYSYKQRKINISSDNGGLNTNVE